MLNFRSFRTGINEAFGNYYKTTEDEFKDRYQPHKMKRTGNVTHVYNKLGDEIATYNHDMKVLSTNRTHDDLKLVSR